MSELKHSLGLDEDRKKVAYDGMPVKAQRAFDLGWEMAMERTAATELLEALERVCSWRDAIELVAPDLGGCLIAIDNARAVIAKATGGSDE